MFLLLPIIHATQFCGGFFFCAFLFSIFMFYFLYFYFHVSCSVRWCISENLFCPRVTRNTQRTDDDYSHLRHLNGNAPLQRWNIFPVACKRNSKFDRYRDRYRCHSSRILIRAHYHTREISITLNSSWKQSLPSRKNRFLSGCSLYWSGGKD